MSGNNLVALVAGGSGLVGSALIDAMLTSGAFDKVVAVARRPLSRPPHERLEVVRAELDALPALPRATHAFCALGTTMKQAGSKEAFRAVDEGGVLAFARRAKEAGAERFVVVSSQGANPRSPGFYLRVKGEVEAALSTLGFSALHIVRPSILEGPRQERRPGEQIGVVLARAVSKLVPSASIAPIAGVTVARAMMKLALQGEVGTHVYEAGELRKLGG